MMKAETIWSKEKANRRMVATTIRTRHNLDSKNNNFKINEDNILTVGKQYSGSKGDKNA